MFKSILLALYILSGLGVIVIDLTVQYDVRHYVRDNEIKFKPFPLSQRVARKIDDLICTFCPIMNSIAFLGLIINIEAYLKEEIDAILKRQIFDKEEE